MKTLNVYSYDIKGRSPKFRELELWEIERDNLGLLGIQDTFKSDFDYVSPDCICITNKELSWVIFGRIPLTK